MSNRRKHANSIPLGSLAKWVAAAFFMGVAGLSYVHFKNELHSTGSEIKSLERQIADMDTEAQIAEGRISELSSRATLQRRMKEGFIKMIPIADISIVRLNNSPTEVADLRPVANKRFGK